jgi:carbamoyltransferase
VSAGTGSGSYPRRIEPFGKATGVPALNISFNLKSEPILITPAQALATFARSGMEVRVLGDRVLEERTAGGSVS